MANHILTELGDSLVTEGGDFLVTEEDSVASAGAHWRQISGAVRRRRRYHIWWFLPLIGLLT